MAFKAHEGFERAPQGAVDRTTGISLRWVKQWDVQPDPHPSYVSYIFSEYAGRINPDGSFTPK